MSLLHILRASAFTLALLVAGGAQAATDAEQITHSMKSTWEKPDAPLTVEPVVVAGSYAVAGWAQGERGGRALLRKDKVMWVVYLCGGDQLRSARELETAGIPKAQATQLAGALAAAERKTSPALLQKFATFQGIVNVSGDAGHAMHHDHGAMEPAKQ